MNGSRRIFLSALFTTFNQVRHKPQFEKGRLNRALGLLMQNDQGWRSEYSTTLTDCICRDNTGRALDPDTLEVIATWKPNICKHRIAVYIESLM
jgi:hypothetical protein